MPSTKLIYDKLNRLTKKVTQAGAVYYAYDASGRRTSLKDTDLNESVYTWDASGRLESVQLNGARTAQNVYDAAGRLVTRVMPGGPGEVGHMVQYFTYDLGGRLASAESRGPTYSDLLSSAAYTRNANGLPTQIDHENSEHSYFEYDTLSRLTREYRLGGNTYDNSYSYDKAGNRTQKVDNAASETINYTINSLNLVTQELNVDTDVTRIFEYDSAQRMTAIKVEGQQSAYFSYDQRGFTSQVDFAKASGADGTVKFSRNGVGELTRLADGSSSTESYWSWDGTRAITERSTSGAGHKFRHDLTEGRSLIEIETSGGTELYPVLDHRGSMDKIEEGDGPSENSYVFDSFGKLVASSGSLITTGRWRFLTPGMVKLAPVNQDLYWAPWTLYEPEAGIPTALANFRGIWPGGTGVWIDGLFYAPGPDGKLTQEPDSRPRPPKKPRPKEEALAWLLWLLLRFGPFVLAQDRQDGQDGQTPEEPTPTKKDDDDGDDPRDTPPPWALGEEMDGPGCPSLYFDGKELALIKKGWVVESVFALSGSDKWGAIFRSDKNTGKWVQRLSFLGPLPEGIWWVDPCVKREVSAFLSPKRYMAWGGRNTPLSADPSTTTYGRSGFYIHGSRLPNPPGSAGCIDVGKNDLHVFGDWIDPECGKCDRIRLVAAYPIRFSYPKTKEGRDIWKQKMIESGAFKNL